MDKTNKIVSLIKYDYRFLFYFKDQMDSLMNYYVHKFSNNIEKYQVYLISREKYIKRLQKKKYYENLYLRNKLLYYIIFTEKLFSKYIRKQLYKDLIYLLKSAVISFIIEIIGLKFDTKKLLPFFV